MRVVVSTVVNVHIVNVSDMYKVRKYHSLDSETFERSINNFFFIKIIIVKYYNVLSY